VVLKRIGPVSCAKISGTLYAVIGLFVGAIFSLISLAGGFASESFGGAAMGAMFGVGAIFIFPIMYGCLGFVGALIMAWVYNLVAGWVGGVEVDLQ
jgi:hypothetical protein